VYDDNERVSRIAKFSKAASQRVMSASRKPSLGVRPQARPQARPPPTNKPAAAPAPPAVGAAQQGIIARLGVLPTLDHGMKRQKGTYIFRRGRVSTGARPEGESHFSGKEVAVFRHKDDTQEFEVLPNDKALTDRVEARKLVGERYKKIKERAANDAAAGNAIALQQNAITAVALQQQSELQQQAGANIQAGMAMFANGVALQQQAQEAGDAAASATASQQNTLVRQQADLATLQDGSNNGKDDAEPATKKPDGKRMRGVKRKALRS